MHFPFLFLLVHILYLITIIKKNEVILRPITYKIPYVRFYSQRTGKSFRDKVR